MAASLGHLPNEGDTITISNLTLTVREMKDRRVAQIELTRRESGAGEGPS